MKYIVALDEGTTSTRAVIYNLDKRKIEKVKNVAIKQYYPAPGYVEESATEIYSSTMAVLVDAIETVGPASVMGIGVTNQRESVIAWERSTGKPLYNAIIWQCRRTMDYCSEIEGLYGNMIKRKTGLKVDSYFSASKMRWLINNVSEVKGALERKDLCLGTIESFLIFKLTGGKVFVSDYTNASRTMLYNINTMEWDDELLSLFGIPKKVLPEVVAPDIVYGEFEYGGKKIPIAGSAGDQQSAAIGQGCFDVGSAKMTYGTGMFMLANVGDEFKNSPSLLTTLGYSKKPVYMFEGSVFNAGSAVQWLRDELEFFKNSKDSEKLALSVDSTGGVYVVPAFTGLGSPYWRSDASGLITGITRGTNKGHITRAVLESMAYSARDLIDIMEREGGVKLDKLRVDGGASQNNFLMQFQSDVINVPVDRPVERESTALGAVYLCEIALGINSLEEISNSRVSERVFAPDKNREKYEKMYDGWKNAVKRCLL